jgi:hypothetical protein
MSSHWEWFFAIIGLVGFIIGLVAFLMAAPYFLQLLFGQPQIGLVFSYDDSESEGRLIRIHLMNPPIKNRLLKAFRVSRLPAQSVCLSITVINNLTRQVIADSFTTEIDTFQSSKSIRAVLPPSILLANVSLVQWQRSTNSAVLSVGTRLIPLGEGTYIFLIRIDFDGETKRFKPILLHIGQTENEMTWDKSIMGKFLV